MNVVYTHSGVTGGFELEDIADLPAVCNAIMGRLLEELPDVAGQPGMVVKITDGVLNSLSDDRQLVELGEISPDS